MPVDDVGVVDSSGYVSDVCDASDVGDIVSFAGIAARGYVNGRGPTRSVGRDEVGTCSDGANPNLPYHLC